MNRSLLAVLAHPDDESFGLGGTLARYARLGCDVYLVCATRGEAGVVEVDHMRDAATIAELRENELRCAAEQLGLKGVYFLGYRDSGMPESQDNRHPDAQINHPLGEVAGRVVRYIRELKPDVVLTFDPIGGYRHPDHIHIHQAARMAFERADDAGFHPEAGAPFKPAALYFQVFPRTFLKWLTRLMPLFGKDPSKWGRNGDIDLKALADVNFPTHARIDIRKVSEIKRKAGECHASQGGIMMRRGLIGLLTRLVGGHEDYMRAYPPVDGHFRVTNDLFEGI